MKAHLQPTAGFKEIALLMELISEPKKYKKIIKELKEMHDKINESITVADTVEKANGYLSDSKAELSATRRILAEEKDQISQFRKDSLTVIKTKEANFDKSVSEIDKKQTAFSESLATLQESLNEKAIDLTNREKELTVKSDFLENKEIALSELKEDLSRKSKLMKETAANLG